MYIGKTRPGGMTANVKHKEKETENIQKLTHAFAAGAFTK